jgi:hypothetical protein
MKCFFAPPLMTTLPSILSVALREARRRFWFRELADDQTVMSSLCPGR